MQYHRLKTRMALGGLLFLVAALGNTPALAAQKVEAFHQTLSTPELAVASGPSSPEEMDAFLDALFQDRIQGGLCL